MQPAARSDHRFRRAVMLPIWIVLFALLVSGCGILAGPRVYRVGILSGGAAFSPAAEGFKARMVELGYNEGENITYDFHVNPDKRQQQEIIQQFVHDKVDMIFAFPTDSALAAKAATLHSDIPVVFCIATLEGADLVQSVREPGGNLTGVRQPGADVVVKRFELLLQIVPHARRVAVLYSPDYTASVNALVALEPVARTAEVELIVVPINTAEEIAPELQPLAEADQVGAMLMLPSTVLFAPAAWQQIASFAAEQHLPLVGGGNITGAIFTYTPDYDEAGRLAAPTADKILHGTPAGSIPVITAEAQLKINYPLIQELGLMVPDGLLMQADEVIR